MASRSARVVGISLRFGAALVIAIATAALLDAQIPGRNVNMVSGRTLPFGDPYLQRQNEPSIAASTRNPLHLLAGSNDYRTVDLPGFSNSIETGDAWMGVFKSYDGGNTWRSTLIPGYPQDPANVDPTNPNPSPLRHYAAAADPVVRAGTNGLFYYSGIVFDRETVVNSEIVKGKSALFVSRFIDNNNQEAGDPIVFLNTNLVATSPMGGPFIDKPWFVVDRPRTGAQICTIPATRQKSPTVSNPNRVIEVPPQSIAGGAAYVVYSLISGDGAETRSQIYFKRSLDCGNTWSDPVQISSIADPINQGATLAVDPNSGAIYIAWRRFTADGTDDSIMVTRSLDQGRKWDPPGRARRFPRGKKVGLQAEIHGQKFKQATELAPLASLDQPTESYQFRTNAYPTMAVDGGGRVYVAWSERGFAPLNQDPDDGDARILIASSTTGAAWTEPALVANDAIVGHQVMPTLSFAGGKLMVAYYDFREDVSGIFMKFIDERWAVVKRHTVDVRAAMASPATNPVFGPSVRVSEYLMGSRPGSGPRPVEQLQFNPPNLKLFRLGSVPFFGDYIDLTASPAFVPTSGGGWVHNTAPSAAPLFHVVWTDNRDVIPPANGDWTTYTPPGSTGGPSTYDPTKTVDMCMPGHEGMRNQNIYTARITGGLVAGSPGNTKPLSSTLPRSFVVFAQNATETTRTYRLTILNQPVGGRASFLQDSVFPATETPPFTPPAVVTTLDVQVPRRSTVVRSVFATSSDPDAQINVSVTEILGVGGAEAPGGAQTTVVLNPDISNPDISNPDISNPDISNPDISNPDISNAEVSNPDISNPDISNPDISNPDISNPDISNPDISNTQVANPDISNPDISNPDISNPDISNPDISNPDISNPDISNQSLTDTTWTITNDGNTASSYSVKLLLTGDAPLRTQNVVQLILHKVYRTPVSVNCALGLHTQNVLLANINNPTFVDGDDPLANPDISNPDISNATLWLAPGESGKITVRVLDVNVHDNATFDAVTQVKPVAVAQAKDVAIGPGGGLVIGADEPIALPPGLNVQFTNVPVGVETGQPVGLVSVRVIDPTGAPLPGVAVALTVHQVPSDAPVGLPLNALTNEAGIASFNVPTLAAGRYRLRAQAVFFGFAPTIVYSREIVVSTTPAPGVTGSLTYNSGSEAGVWTQNVSQNFELHIDMATKQTTLRINGAAITGFIGVPFVDPTAANLAQVSMQVGPQGAGQVLAWDGVQVRNASGNVVLLNGNFDDDTVGAPPSTNPPAPPAGDAFAIGLTGTVFVQASSGNMVSRPVELSQPIEGPPATPTLTGLVAGTPPATGIWVVSWKSLVRAPGTQVFATIVVRDQSSRTIASVEYRPATQLTVTNAGSEGAGSLRQAILEANANGPSQDVIRFNIPGVGPHTIALQALLPAIEHPVTIDGTTQPGYAGSPRVFVSGALIPGIQLTNAGLRVEGANSDIRGLGIIRFSGAGILLFGADNSRVRGNYIGVDANGAAAPNHRGVQLQGLNQRIGGTTPADRNVISANTNTGIFVTSDAGNAIIEGNFIGTDPTGTLARGNGAGIVSDDTSNTMIGGITAGAGNVISANTANGILLTSSNTDTQIHGNFIGTDVTGTLDLGNLEDGIRLNGNALRTNIGVAGAGNLISGNNSDGIEIGDSASITVVIHNRIGTNAAGTAAIPNGTRNEFFDVVGAGVRVNGFNNKIGAPNEGNLISGNGTGVSLDGFSTGNAVRGNFIGTNAAGTLPIGNRFGIFNTNADNNQIGGPAGGEGNVVSGNTVEGIAITGEGSNTILIQGNRVGTNAAGTAGMANQFDGIRIGFGASQVSVGGDGISGSNFIAFNGSNGINAEGSGNAILRNSIHSNVGLGINQSGGGVTLNDTPDANGVQNFPVLSFARTIAEGVQVVGTLNTTPGASFQVIFYLNDNCDPSGHGEGQIPFASIDGLITDGAGNAAIDMSVLMPVTVGHFVTATARNLANNNTSEFSACVTVTDATGFEIVGPVGGAGGSAFTRACPAGQVGVGILGRAGDDIDRTELICAPRTDLAGTRSSAGAIGTFGGIDYGATLSCGSGFYMTGIHGTAGTAGPGNIVDTLGVFCQHPEGGVTANGPVGLPWEVPTAPFNLSCTGGRKVIGIQGRQGLVLDQISLICQ